MNCVFVQRALTDDAKTATESQWVPSWHGLTLDVDTFNLFPLWQSARVCCMLLAAHFHRSCVDIQRKLHNIFMNHIHLAVWIPVLTSSQGKKKAHTDIVFFSLRNLRVWQKLVWLLRATQTIRIGNTDLSSQLCVKINAYKSALLTCHYKSPVLNGFHMEYWSIDQLSQTRKEKKEGKTSYCRIWKSKSFDSISNAHFSNVLFYSWRKRTSLRIHFVLLNSLQVT